MKILSVRHYFAVNLCQMAINLLSNVRKDKDDCNLYHKISPSSSQAWTCETVKLTLLMSVSSVSGAKGKLPQLYVSH